MRPPPAGANRRTGPANPDSWAVVPSLGRSRSMAAPPATIATRSPSTTTRSPTLELNCPTRESVPVAGSRSRTLPVSPLRTIQIRPAGPGAYASTPSPPGTTAMDRAAMSASMSASGSMIVSVTRPAPPPLTLSMCSKVARNLSRLSSTHVMRVAMSARRGFCGPIST